MKNHRHITHISREDLYTDLEARIRYLHSFIDFSSRDIEALITGAKYVRALIPAVVNIVYKKLLQYDITARAFTTRSTSFEGPMDEQPDEDSPQILHRKKFLRAYLNKLCSDPSRMEFWEYLDKVGMMHVGLGRAHPLHIEYVHLGICLGFIQDIMTEAILAHPRLQLQRKIALVKALGKVIWIQNDLMAKWHVQDGAEFVTAGVEEVVVEEEGYLHGKKILEELDEMTTPDRKKSNETGEAGHRGSGSPPTSPSRLPRPSSTSGGVCPFSGLAKGVGGMTLKAEETPRVEVSRTEQAEAAS
ncbi:hypothetical protein SODALDRAFT_326699 [Sodiomyces alkalinus F11]|uniref:Globin-sensor domain-containing protein n=1 Tax=Sodiomyces alkalinus (strain CBS 110278 / VKM F-3762 / F11) TaxID=1314773 RepID=A0A3N2Q6X2_SODAK|nr:hypothetical protein SODALDRAFT_326699 [Sodiomyces alkalinus F11]ROT42539.1 hypothetical protein SODALDRAFT_326699 [Sodiomyces alkalinus F11]